MKLLPVPRKADSSPGVESQRLNLTGSPLGAVIAVEAVPPQPLEPRQRPSPSLINRNAQSFAYLGLLLLLLAASAAIGLTSRKRVMSLIVILMAALALAAVLVPQRSEPSEPPAEQSLPLEKSLPGNFTTFLLKQLPIWRA